MTKRRNSPYAPHDRRAARRVTMDCTPALLAPGRITRPQGGVDAGAALWSPAAPSGGFIL
jgi:hypothetical protein